MSSIFSFIVLLALGTATSWLGCLVPFAAIAASAALTLRARHGALVVAVVWGANQALGFGVHHYGTAPATLVWGIAIGLAAAASFALARVVRARPLVAFVASFAAFQAVLMAFSVALGGWSAYAPAIEVQLFAVNLGWFALTQALTAALARRSLIRALI